MLGRLVAKLMLKACVPLIAVAGVMSYGVYLKGGDPLRMWGHVASGAFGQAGDMFDRAKNDAASLADNLTVGSPVGTLLDEKAAQTTVYKWKDADGVTHFGTQKPGGILATSVTIDPNTNVVAAVKAPAVRVEREDSGGASNNHREQTPLAGSHQRSPRGGASEKSRSVQDLESAMGEPLPGVAGQLLSNGVAGSGGMDPSQLIKLLQSAGQQ